MKIEVQNMKIFNALARNKTLELTMILHISEKKISCFFKKKSLDAIKH